MNHLFINGKTFEECRMAAEAEERAQKVHNGEHWDELKACSESDGIVICEGPAKVVYHPPVANIEKLTAAARSKEIIVNVPKLNIEKKDPLDITGHDPILEALIKFAPHLNEPPREIISKEFLEKEILPKLKTEKVENEMNKIDIAQTTTESLVEELARREREAAAAAEQERLNEQRHLDHPFYQRAKEYREEERYHQILKGAAKYPKPFSPDDWTPKELVQHAMQENIDQAHYIYGLYEKIEAVQKHLETVTEQRDWENNRANALENQVKHLQTCKESYSKQLEVVGRLTEFLLKEFPEAGKANEWSVDVAIDLLKNYKFYMDGMVPKGHYDELRAKYAQLEQDYDKAHETYNETRQANTELLTELNGLAKYLIVHYPNMVDEGRWATGIAKDIMDAYRNGGGINAKG